MAKSKPEIQPALFATSPHGAQELRHTEPPEMRCEKIGNQLFTLYAPDTKHTGNEPWQITMTGEEMDSLCAQWHDFRSNINW